MINPPSSPPQPLTLAAASDVPADELNNSRNLLKMVRLAHALNAKEQELALVLLQTIAAWNGLDEAGKRHNS